MPKPLLLQFFVWLVLCLLCLLRLRSTPKYKVEDILRNDKSGLSAPIGEIKYQVYVLVLALSVLIIEFGGGFLLFNYGGLVQQGLYAAGKDCLVISSVFVQDIFLTYFFVLFGLLLLSSNWIFPIKAWEAIVINIYVNMRFLDYVRDVIEDPNLKIRKRSALALLLTGMLKGKGSAPKFPLETKKYLHLSARNLIDMRALAKSVQRLWNIIAFWLIGIFGLFSILVVDNYVKYCPGKLYINSYWELTEQEYSYQNIKQGTLYTILRQSSGEVYCQLHFKIQMDTGDEFEMFYQTLEAVSMESIIKTMQYLKNNNVRVDVLDIPNEHMQALQKDSDYMDKVDQIFRTAKELFGIYAQS